VDRSDKVFLVLVAAALAAAVVLAAGRARVEQGNRTVDIIIDADDARQVAAAAGVALPELLLELRAAGASALAVREVTLGELVAGGRVLAMSTPGRTRLASPDGALMTALAEAIQDRLPQARVETAGSPPGLAVGLNMDQLDALPVVLRREDLRAAGRARLSVVARLSNFPAVSPAAIEAAAAEAEAAGAELVVFREEEVLGYDGLLSETMEAMRRHGLLYGFVEMAGQQGDAALARQLSDGLIRVHSISDSDMLTISPRAAAARYARAARERNIRACYVRLVSRASRDPAATNINYVAGIADSLHAAGFRIDSAVPFVGPEGWPPAWLRIIVAVGVPAGFLLLLRRLIPLPSIWAWLVFALMIACAGAMRGALLEMVVPVAGLAAAVVFPTLGTVWILQAARARGAGGSTWETVRRAGLGLAVASAGSAVGAMLIVGLYARVHYMAGVGAFSGVKVAHLAPLVVVALAVIADVPGRKEPLKVWWMRVRLRVGEFFGRPVLIVEALVVLAAFAAIAFALTRTGNQPVVAPSGTEIKLRGMLESLLSVRPRTKEMLVGHPALMLSIALALRGRRAWLPLAAFLGVIGQVSLVNTFCHLHTPLAVSFLRTAHGLWIGAAVGVIVILVWRLVFVRAARTALR